MIVLNELPDDVKIINKLGRKYAISKNGDVYSFPNQRVKKYRKHIPRVHSHGYLRVSFRDGVNQKDYYIHRLVAECFLQKIEGMNEVNHKDGNKKNNSVENLEWSNRHLNNKHAFKTGLRSYEHLKHMAKKAGKIAMERMRKFDDKTILEIVNKYRTGEYTQLDIAKNYNVSRSCIGAIVNFKTFKYLKKRLESGV